VEQYQEGSAGEVRVKFKSILADPAWEYECWSDGGARRGCADAHYEVRGADWIASLPVLAVADMDCLLFLWATWPNLPEALSVISRWGFEYKTLAFSWVKANRNGEPRMGLGHWTRANTEPCLLAKRGTPKRMDKAVEQVIVSGLGEHSEKPEAQYERIERLVEGRYLELFHRPRNGLFPPHAGWTFLGNEVDGQDIVDALKALA
jgi:N6-adenosine-specific RNA methylase IME4